MRKIAVTALLLAVSATAQSAPATFGAQAPKIYIFAGYSYLHRFQALHGWNVSATWHVYRCLGVTADFSGHYRSDSGVAFAATNPISFSTHDHLHSFTFGPTLTLRNHTRFTPYAHYLLGVLRFTNSFSSTSTGSGTALVGSSSTSLNDFNEYFGGGLDIGVNRRFAVRAGQLSAVSPLSRWRLGASFPLRRWRCHSFRQPIASDLLLTETEDR